MKEWIDKTRAIIRVALTREIAPGQMMDYYLVKQTDTDDKDF